MGHYSTTKQIFDSLSAYRYRTDVLGQMRARAYQELLLAERRVWAATVTGLCFWLSFSAAFLFELLGAVTYSNEIVRALVGVAFAVPTFLCFEAIEAIRTQVARGPFFAPISVLICGVVITLVFFPAAWFGGMAINSFIGLTVLSVSILASCWAVFALMKQTV